MDSVGNEIVSVYYNYNGVTTLINAVSTTVGCKNPYVIVNTFASTFSYL